MNFQCSHETLTVFGYSIEFVHVLRLYEEGLFCHVGVWGNWFCEGSFMQTRLRACAQHANQAPSTSWEMQKSKYPTKV